MKTKKENNEQNVKKWKEHKLVKEMKTKKVNLITERSFRYQLGKQIGRKEALKELYNWLSKRSETEIVTMPRDCLAKIKEMMEK